MVQSTPVIRLSLLVLCLALPLESAYAQRGGRARSRQDSARARGLIDPFSGMPIRVAPRTLPEGLVDGSEDYRFSYGPVASAAVRVSSELHRTTIVSSAELLTEKRRIECEALIASAHQRVETFGALKGPLTIYLVERIAPKRLPWGWDPSLVVMGTYFERNGESCFAICEHYFSTGNMAHELVHAIAREQKLEIPVWLEEGIAEYYEATDGVSAEHLETLQRSGALTLQELHRYSPVSAQERQVRASSWAVVYTWCAIDRKPLVDLLREHPSVNVAAAATAVLKR